MSKRNGNKSRANLEQKKKAIRRKHSRKLLRDLRSKAVTQEVPGPAGVEGQFVSSRLRRLPGESAADPGTLEIVVLKAPKDRPND